MSKRVFPARRAAGYECGIKPFVVKNGFIDIPTAPGLGIELDDDAIADKIGVPHIDGKPPVPGAWVDLFLNAAGMKPLPPANGPIGGLRFNPAAPMPNRHP